MQWVAPEVEPGQKHSTNEDIFMRDGSVLMERRWGLC